jgi:hypothetical protein
MIRYGLLHLFVTFAGGIGFFILPYIMVGTSLSYLPDVVHLTVFCTYIAIWWWGTGFTAKIWLKYWPAK